MAEEESKKVEVQGSSETAPPPTEPTKDVSEEKAVIPPPSEEKADDSKALAVVEKNSLRRSLRSILLLEVVADTPTEKSTGGSTERVAILARLETEKRISLIKAWEENEKVKVENKAVKQMSSITAWENSKMAAMEAELKAKEEELEKMKAEYAEKMKNKVAMIHKAAEEKRAYVEAKRGEDILKAEETAAKYRSKGLAPKKIFGCFGA
ncbi:remorin-like isoform X1 [Phoenix dactylifera]|uniref:Remorin-like isoform X1 n=1 Tax=Phoenix dactylifera TaxID=42345 RepID=A0A8B9A7S5_PHODC|nr:remorin-like isoform X1 [Phoenix dactylifera]